MSINILAELDALINQGLQYRGAVLLTYSLNLQFFEQLVQPRLDALGCTHVLIISDTFGYQETLERHLHQLSGVGRRYVCAPLSSARRGVQHSKMLLLVSEKAGWMLVGSGNLTFQGYGQNLELFDQFSLQVGKEAPTDSNNLPLFRSAWRLVRHLQPTLSKTAQTHIELINEQVSWLSTPAQPHPSISLWHSYDRPLLDHLRQLEPVNELQLIAPFIDKAVVEGLLAHFKPNRLVVGVNATTPNLDASSINAFCLSTGCTFELRAIQALKTESARGLHAKAIIGIHDTGCWCLAGSANITRPALVDHWNAQGNLELVVFRSSPDLKAFDSIWVNEIISTCPASIQATSMESVEHNKETSTPTVILTELAERNGFVEGSIDFRGDFHYDNLQFELELSDQTFPIVLDSNRRFGIQLSESPQTPNAGRVCAKLPDGDTVCSPKVFIDQPHELEHYSTRAFHRSMRAKIDSVRDAVHTFKELMEFLFNRVNRENATENLSKQKRSRRDRRRNTVAGEETSQSEILSVEDFITNEELVWHIGRHIDELNPYERDHYSLRDLLSLVLLRLTTETIPQRVLAASTENEEDELAIDEELESQYQDQRVWQDWLVKYLTGYCKRYGQRLTDSEFIENTGPALIFQNHYTLARILLEFHEKTEIFTSGHLREAVRQIWSPLFKQDGVLDSFASIESHETILRLWEEASLTPIFVVTVSKAWSDPIPQWEQHYRIKAIQRFMYVRRIIDHATSHLGSQFWQKIDWSQVDWYDLRGFQKAKDLIAGSPATEHYTELVQRFEELANFVTPIEQRYAQFFHWHQLKKEGSVHSSEAQNLASILQQTDAGLFDKIKQGYEIRPVVGDRRECPVSFMELPSSWITKLRRGDLIESPHVHRVLLYWKPDLDEQKVKLSAT